MVIKRKDALVALLDTLYEEFGDDLPAHLRLPIALVRHISAKATDGELKDLRKATKEDIERAVEQSKLATEYAAKSMIEIDKLPAVIELVIQEEVDRVLTGLARLRDDVSVFTEEMTAEVADAEIDSAKMLLKDGHDHVALDRLQQLKTKKWPKLDDWHRYRIEQAIGSVLEFRGDLKGAARQYLVARKHQSSGEHPRCYEAAARMYLGEQKVAYELSKSICKDFPDSALAAQILIRSAPSSLQFSEIVREIPSHLQDDAGVASAMAQRAMDAGQTDEALAYVRNALKAAPEAPGVLHEAALVLIDLETIGRRQIRAAEPYIDITGRLEEAVSLLSKAIKRLGSGGPTRRLSSLRYNRALILELLGRFEAARGDLERVTQDMPEDRQFALAFARHLLEHASPESAIAILEPLAEGTDSAPEEVLCLAQAYLYRGSVDDLENALDALQRHHAKTSGRHDSLHYEIVERTLTLLCLNKDMKGAEEYIRAAKDNLLPIEWHLVYSHFLSHSENVSKAKSEALAALKLLNEGDLKGEWDWCYRVAESLTHAGLDAEALPLWKIVSPPDCVGPMLYKLLSCAKKCEAYDVIRDYCKEIRDRGYIDEFCLELEIETLQRFNALNDAVRDLRELLRADPTHKLAPQMRLWLSLTGLKLGKQELVEQNAELLPSPHDIRLQNGLAVIRVLHSSDQKDAAISYAYELYRHFPGEELAYAAVITACLFGAGGAERFKTHDKVELDCAVGYAYEEHGEIEWRILESSADPAPDLSRQEISSDSPLAGLLLDTAKGDVILLPGAPTRSIHVRQVIDKRLFRGQKCLHEFERMFPMSQFIRSVKVVDDGTGEYDFSALADVLKSQDESEESIIKVYAELGICPIQMLSHRLGRHVVETIQQIACSSVAELNCAPGDPVQRQRSMNHLRLASTVVIDSTALATLFLTEQVEMLARLSGRIILTEGTLAELREFKSRWFEGERTAGTLHLHEDKPVIREWTEGERAKNQVLIDRLFRVIEESCEIVSGFGLAKLDPKKRQNLEDIFGQITAESIIVARDNNAMLWSDDLATSMCARNEEGVEFAWTQLIGQLLCSQSLMSADELQQLTLNLLGLTYWFTSVDPHTIMFALSKSEWHHDRWPFKAVAAHLCDSRVSSHDAYRMLRAVMVPIWREAPDNASRERVLLGLFSLIQGRSGGDTIIASLKRDVFGSFGLDVLGGAAVSQLLRASQSAVDQKIILPSPSDLVFLRRPQF